MRGVGRRASKCHVSVRCTGTRVPVEGDVEDGVHSELVGARGDRVGVDDAGEEGEGGGSGRRLSARGTNLGAVRRGLVAVVALSIERRGHNTEGR